MIAARKMPDDVSDEDKEDRRKRLDALNNTILEEKNKPYQDQTIEVLVESKTKDKWRGRDPHNRLVFFPDDRDLTGAVVTVKIFWTGPFSLQGELVDVVVPALRPKASELLGGKGRTVDPLPSL